MRERSRWLKKVVVLVAAILVAYVVVMRIVPVVGSDVDRAKETRDLCKQAVCDCGQSVQAAWAHLILLWKADTIPIDGYGREMIVTISSLRTVTVRSLGPDGVDGTDDDIVESRALR